MEGGDLKKLSLAAQRLKFVADENPNGLEAKNSLLRSKILVEGRRYQF